MELQRDRIHAGTYTGPTTGRGALQYSREWMDTSLGSVDSLILEQLNLSQQQGRHKVTIIDIGSTRQATFLTDVLTNPLANLGTRRFLDQNPSFSLDMIGLTDATSPAELGSVISSPQPETTQISGSMKVVGYTLTATQTLERFMASQRIESPNLIFAVWSLAYLSPNIFKEVLNSSVFSLESGGRFIGSGYSDSVSAFGFAMDYSQYPNLIYFIVKDASIPDEVWPYLIGGPAYSDRPELTGEQARKVKQVMPRFLKPLSQHNLITDDQRNYVLSEVRRARSISRLSSAGSTLKEPIAKLWDYKFQEVMKLKKDATIQELMENNNCIVESDFVKNISIQKI